MCYSGVSFSGENAVLNIVGAEAGHTSPATENGSSQDSGKPEEEDLPLFAVVNGEVHLGSGLKIKETRLKYITASRQEMKVARDLARHYWTPAQMEVRCVSGLPSRNPEGPIVTRERATPAKLDAIMNVIQNMVHEHPTDVPAAKRVANGRKALRDLFAEAGRHARKLPAKKSPPGEASTMATEAPAAGPPPAAAAPPAAEAPASKAPAAEAPAAPE
ncbi:uncharacterized protein LOC144158268 [Haemaphysalis longicornis]